MKEHNRKTSKFFEDELLGKEMKLLITTEHDAKKGTIFLSLKSSA